MAEEHDTRAAWEARSQLYGASLRSVLFQGLPERVNAHLHQWHTQFLLQHIVPKPHLRILDIGCGFGRLTLPILQQCPDAEVLGVDISPTFVDLFRQTTLQNALVGSLDALPPDIGPFDYIICVTVLMYVETQQLQEAMRNLVRLLRPEGTLLLIENDFLGFCCSVGPLTCVQRALRKKPSATPAHLFRRRTVRMLVEGSGAVVRHQRGLPFTTVCLVPLACFFAYCPQFFLHDVCLRLFAWLDRACGSLALPSLYRGYVIAQASSHTTPSRQREAEWSPEKR